MKDISASLIIKTPTCLSLWQPSDASQNEKMLFDAFHRASYGMNK